MLTELQHATLPGGDATHDELRDCLARMAIENAELRREVEKIRHEQRSMDSYHMAKLDDIREFAKRMISEPIANSDIDTVEQSGQLLLDLCGYCDRLRKDYEAREKKSAPVARVTVFGKDWKLHYLSLPVGTHDLYAEIYTYTETPNTRYTSPVV